MDSIKLLVKEPNKEPYIKEVENELENLQEIVGGDIECIEMPGERNIDIYLNEEDKLLTSPGNMWIAGSSDFIVGTCFMVGFDPKTGENISLTDEQIETCKNYIDYFVLPEDFDYFSFLPIMDNLSKHYFKKSIVEM